MNSLEKKIAVSELIIREAVDGLSRPRINILWSGGKDSTTVLHIVKNMYGEVPFTVTFADCTLEFPEVYTFIEKVTKLWKLRLEKLTYASPEALRKFDETGRKDRKILVREKAKASKAYIKERNIQLSLSGIRWYEHFHKINRFKGKYAGLNMIYPILHWTHQDIWEYIRTYQVPYLPLYDQGYSHVDLRPFSHKDARTA